jgi:hypothetical protein
MVSEPQLRLNQLFFVTMDKRAEPKLNWWLDVVLLLAAPAISVLAALSKATQDQMAFVVLSFPAPLAVIVGVRLAMRIKGHIALKIILGIIFAAVLYVALCIAGMFGCAWSGGPFNIH